MFAVDAGRELLKFICGTAGTWICSYDIAYDLPPPPSPSLVFINKKPESQPPSGLKRRVRVPWMLPHGYKYQPITEEKTP